MYQTQSVNIPFVSFVPSDAMVRAMSLFDVVSGLEIGELTPDKFHNLLDVQEVSAVFEGTRRGS